MPFRDVPGGCLVQIRVIPRAARTALDGTRGGALLVRLSAPPVEGAANDALLRFLAELFGVPRRAVHLTAGERSRDKRVRIDGLSSADARHRLTGSA